MLTAFTHVSVPSFFFRVTCGLWESPPSRWQKVLPVSTFLWVKSVAGLPCRYWRFLARSCSSFISATPSPAWTQAGIVRKQSHLKSTRNPFISEGCEDLVFMRRNKKAKGSKLWESNLFTDLACSLFLNYSSPVVKLRPSHKGCKRQRNKNSQPIFSAWVMWALALHFSHSY